jgi:hypothetical protein
VTVIPGLCEGAKDKASSHETFWPSSWARVGFEVMFLALRAPAREARSSSAHQGGPTPGGQGPEKPPPLPFLPPLPWPKVGMGYRWPLGRIGSSHEEEAPWPPRWPRGPLDERSLRTRCSGTPTDLKPPGSWLTGVGQGRQLRPVDGDPFDLAHAEATEGFRAMILRLAKAGDAAKILLDG